MAGLVQDAWGFDGPGGDALALQVNHLPGVGPSASCSLFSNAPYGTKSMRIASHKTDAFYRAGGLHTFTPGGITMIVQYIRIVGNTPPGAAWPVDSMLAAVDPVSDRFFRIRYDDGGHLELWDSSNTQLDILSFGGGVWKRIAVLFQPGEAVGDWAWYSAAPDDDFVLIDGTAAFGGGEAKADFSGPAGSTLAVILGGQGGIQPPDGGVMTVYHNNGYQKDNVGGIADAEGVADGRGGTGDFRIIYDPDYQIVKNSATPDCNESGAAPNAFDDLDVGTFDLAGDLDLGTQCEYEQFIPFPPPGGGVAKGGGVKVAGPISRSPRPRWISALIGSWLYKGPARTFYGVFGVYDGIGFNVDKGLAFIGGGADYLWDRVCWDSIDKFGVDSHPELAQIVMGMYTSDSEVACLFREGIIATLEPILPDLAPAGFFGFVA